MSVPRPRHNAPFLRDPAAIPTLTLMEPPDGLPPRERLLAIVTIALCVIMAVLDGSIANIALPTIAAELGTTPASSVWVVNAFQLAVMVSLLPLSALGDSHGYRRVFSTGLALFTAASLACALSHSLPQLVVARVCQGFGAAGIMSVNAAIIRYIYPRSQLGRGIGINALVVAISSASGPSIAAGVLSVANWPWLFAINVPLGAVALSLMRHLPLTPMSGRPFDARSAALNAVTLGLLIGGVEGFAHGESRALAFGQLALFLAVGAFYLRTQLRMPHPMLPVDLFRRPVFALSVATSISCYAAQTLAFVSLPFLFQAGSGMSQIETGLLITPWPLAVVVMAPISGRLSDRVSAGLLGGIGLAALIAGLLLIAALPIHAAGWNLAWRMALCGAGFGLFQTPNNRLLLSSAPRERSGAGSGMLSSARLLGQTIGAALVSAVFGITAAQGGDVGQGDIAALTLAAGFSVVAAVVSSLRLIHAA